MKNEYIEVVKRWLAGEVVSVEALQANADAAWAAYTAEAAYVATEAEAAAKAAYVAAARADASARERWHLHKAATAAVSAADADDDAYDADKVDYWVKRYEELINDKEI